MTNSKQYYLSLSPNEPLSTPLKTQSTAHGEQSFNYGALSTEQKRQCSTSHKEFLQNASSITLGEQKIPKDDIKQLFYQMRLLKFLSEEVKYNIKVIKCKYDSNMALTTQRDQRAAKINTAKKCYLNKKTALERKKEKMFTIRNRKDSDITIQTKILKQKIIRMKSLCSERQQSPSLSMTSQQNNNHLKQKHRKHRRINSQFNPSRLRNGTNHPTIFVPIYVPYPVMYPPATNYLHPQHQPHVINNFTSNQHYQPPQAYPSPPAHHKSVSASNEEKLFTSRLRQFSKNLEVSLSNRQSRKSVNNNLVFSQDNKQPESIRNSCKSATSKNQLSKKRSAKLPFITDDEMVEQTNQIIQTENTYSKMGFKITTSNACQQPDNKRSNSIKKKTNVPLFQRFQTIEEVNNSALNISEKRDTSSFERETYKQQKQNDKHHQLLASPRLNKHEQSIVNIDPRDSDTVHQSQSISDKVDILVIPPILHKQIQQSRTKTRQNVNNQNKNINTKAIQQSSVKKQYKSVIVDLQHSIQSKSQQHVKRVESDNQSQIKQQSRPVIPNNENDDDMIFSINLMAESKISRNSIKDNNSFQANTQLKPSFDDEDDILGSIRLSTLSRISRQKGCLKTSQSQIKEVSVAPPTEGRTSISDIRDTDPNYGRNTALTSIQEQQALDELMELNISAPSRIIKKSNVGKQKIKPNLELANASIEQASEEEQANSMSYIHHKTNKKKQKAG